MIDINRDHMLNSLKKGVRFDGRKLLDIRAPLKIEYGVSLTAEGSAKVTLGKTIVMAGVKFETATPFPEEPDSGSLMVNAELIPLSNPEYEPGPPTAKGIEVSRVIDRSLREGKAIDVKKLCIKEGEKVWNVNIDLIPINDDGNLFDIGNIAAFAALKNARFPTIEENGNINYQEKTNEKVALKSVPMSVTVHKIGDHFVVDPTFEEEQYSDARLTIAVKENGHPCSLQKGGSSPLSLEELYEMIDIAVEKSKEYRKALD